MMVWENDARIKKKHPLAVYGEICEWPTLERRLRGNLFTLVKFSQMGKFEFANEVTANHHT